MRREEGSFDHPVELEIGLDLAFVYVEIRLAALLGVIAPVPRLKREIAALAGDHLLQVVGLPQRPRARRLPDPLQKIAGGLRGFRHRIGEAEMREGLIAEEAGTFAAQPHHFCSDGPIIGLPAARTTLDPGAKGLFAQIAPLRHLQKRLDAGACERDDIFARKIARLCRLRRGSNEPVGQTSEIIGGEFEREGFFIGEHVLPELRAERGELFADFGEAGLDFGRKPRTGAAEGQMITLEHPRLLGIEVQLGPTAVEIVDATEQLFVLIDVAVMARHARRDSALDRFDLRIRVGAGEIEENHRSPPQTATGAFQGFDAIGKTCRLGVSCDRRDFGSVFGKGSLESRREMGRLQRPEGRKTEGTCPGGKEGIFDKSFVHDAFIRFRPKTSSHGRAALHLFASPLRTPYIV